MAYLASLTRLRQNVAAEVAAVRLVGTGPAGEAALTRLMEHLDADIAEVRADIEQLIEREGIGW